MGNLTLARRWLMWGTGAVLLAALLGVGAATMIRAHGGDSGLIHACVEDFGDPDEGDVRIVGANDACEEDETAVDWNAVGPAGPPGVLGFYTNTSSFSFSGSSGPFGGGASVTCDAGDQATGGGFSVPFGDGFDLVVTESIPSGNNGWFVTAKRVVAGTFTVDTFVRCADLTP